MSDCEFVFSFLLKLGTDLIRFYCEVRSVPFDKFKKFIGSSYFAYDGIWYIMVYMVYTLRLGSEVMTVFKLCQRPLGSQTSSVELLTLLKKF